jgi:hypothetical protein
MPHWTGCTILTPGDDWEGSRGGTIDPGPLAARVWPDADYGRAFAYLWRRFGPPQPSDHHKQLCEYDLTTPDPEVGFWLACNPSTGGMEPGGWLARARVREIMATDRHARYDWPLIDPTKGIYGGFAAPEGTPTRRALDAIEAGMRDLLRPVFVRDVPINILGPIGDDWDEGLFPEAEHAWQD